MMQMTKLTVAVTNMDTMVSFYNTVFKADLKPIPSSPLFTGKFLNTQLLFCPNTIADVKAEKNRIQMSLTVDDVDAWVQKAMDSGGSIYGDRAETDTMTILGIADPDGNSFELIEMKRN